jgi:adhesin transport system outer membrane protein
MKWIKWTQGVLFTGVVLFSGGFSHAETLQEAVEEMLTSNPDVLTVKYNRLARDQEVRQARSGYLPQLDFIGGVGVQDIEAGQDSSLGTQEYMLSLRQNVFTGFADRNEIERQQSRVKSAAYRLHATADGTALQTAKVYLEVLRNEELLKLALENQLNHQRIADQIKLRSQSGVDSKADMDQIDGRLALADSNVVVTEINLLDAKNNYLAVVGRMPENLIKPEPPNQFMPPSLEDAIQLAIDKHPTLKSANADLEARVSQDRVASAKFMPIVDIEVDQHWRDNVDGYKGSRDELIAAIRLRYNLFHGFTDNARKSETVELVHEAREIRNHTQRQVVESIQLSWMAYQSMLKRKNYLDMHVKYGLDTTKAYTQQFGIGKRTLLDVLNSEAEFIDAKKDVVKNEYDGQIAQYRILNGMGELVHALGVKLPEECLVDNEQENENYMSKTENQENSGS